MTPPLGIRVKKNVAVALELIFVLRQYKKIKCCNTQSVYCLETRITWTTPHCSNHYRFITFKLCLIASVPVGPGKWIPRGQVVCIELGSGSLLFTPSLHCVSKHEAAHQSSHGVVAVVTWCRLVGNIPVPSQNAMRMTSQPGSRHFVEAG